MVTLMSDVGMRLGRSGLCNADFMLRRAIAGENESACNSAVSLRTTVLPRKLLFIPVQVKCNVTEGS